MWEIVDHVLEVKIVDLQKRRDFDYSSPEVLKELIKRSPEGVPLEETIFSPQDILESSPLATVYEQ